MYLSSHCTEQLFTNFSFFPFSRFKVIEINAYVEFRARNKFNMVDIIHNLISLKSNRKDAVVYVFTSRCDGENTFLLLLQHVIETNICLYVHIHAQIHI